MQNCWTNLLIPRYFKYSYLLGILSLGRFYLITHITHEYLIFTIQKKTMILRKLSIVDVL